MYQNMSDDRKYRFMARRFRQVKDWSQECCICQETMLENSPVILACDHAIHLHCYAEHTLAYAQRICEGAVPGDVRAVVDGGAPCPLCRCSFPFSYFRHLVPKQGRD